MSWLTELRYGIAERTELEHVALFSARTPGAAAIAGRVPIVGLIMPDKSDECVAVALTVLDEGAETTVAVQFRYRAGTESRLDTIEDALAESWTSRTAGNLRGVSLILSSWASGASLGQDGNDRVSRSANYQMVVNRQLTYRT